MAIRYIQQENPILEHKWVPINKISEPLCRAVICSEDQKFLSHKGFDMIAIEKAIAQNKKGKKLKGGSTISQQTAKNVFLWPARSWMRKGLEVYFTFLIETLWNKQRILEVYLNSVELGNGVYGAEAAAHFWFNVSANRLTVSQASALAAILPNPRGYKAHPPSKFIQGRKNWIQKQMRFYGPLDLDSTTE